MGVSGVGMGYDIAGSANSPEPPPEQSPPPEEQSPPPEAESSGAVDTYA